MTRFQSRRSGDILAADLDACWHRPVPADDPTVQFRDHESLTDIDQRVADLHGQAIALQA